MRFHCVLRRLNGVGVSCVEPVPRIFVNALIHTNLLSCIYGKGNDTSSCALPRSTLYCAKLRSRSHAWRYWDCDCRQIKPARPLNRPRRVITPISDFATKHRSRWRSFSYHKDLGAPDVTVPVKVGHFRLRTAACCSCAPDPGSSLARSDDVANIRRRVVNDSFRALLRPGKIPATRAGQTCRSRG